MRRDATTRAAALRGRVPKSVLRSITPVPGLLLLFPPWLLHGVAVNLSEGDRVSVAFNVSLEAPQGPAR